VLDGGRSGLRLELLDAPLFPAADEADDGRPLALLLPVGRQVDVPFEVGLFRLLVGEGLDRPLPLGLLLAEATPPNAPRATTAACKHLLALASGGNHGERHAVQEAFSPDRWPLSGCSPSRYTQGKNATASLGSEMLGLGLRGPALLVAGRSPSRLLSSTWQTTFSEAGIAQAVHPFGGECSPAEIER
jgi:hypothetical protein